VAELWPNDSSRWLPVTCRYPSACDGRQINQLQVLVTPGDVTYLDRNESVLASTLLPERYFADTVYYNVSHLRNLFVWYKIALRQTTILCFQLSLAGVHSSFCSNEINKNKENSELRHCKKLSISIRAITDHLGWPSRPFQQLLLIRLVCTAEARSVCNSFKSVISCSVLDYTLCLKKTAQLWNGIARNCNDRFWCYLTEIFKSL